MRTPQAKINHKLALDPKLDKEMFKKKITRTILDQVKGATVDEVFQLVDEGYERLLKQATITMHIPVLVEGLVRAEERRRFRNP
ncbi:MAG: hypothetical protein PVG22_01780 [Chromatiales bacterium]